MNPDELYGDRPFTGLERRTPAPGELLVAAPDLDAPAFARSVIFVVGHDADGTIGVDLTTRSDTAVHTVMEGWETLMAKPPVVYIGGPLSPTQPVCLGVVATGAQLPEEPRPEFDGAPVIQRLADRFALLNLGGRPEEFEGFLTGARLFAGYAAWAPGQLDDEIVRGDWLVAPALVSDLLAPAGVDVWGDVVRRQAWPVPLFATRPVNVREN